MIGTVETIIGPDRSLRGSTGCTGSAASLRGRCPGEGRGGEPLARRTRSRTGGTCTSWGRALRPSAGRARRGRLRAVTGRAAWRSCREGPGLLEELVDALSKPLEAVRVGRLDQARPHDQHVV